MAKKELLADGCSRRNCKLEQGLRQKKSDDRQNHGKWTVCRYVSISIHGIPKLFIQINIGDSKHENKYISLWYIWSLMAISDARDELHRR